MPQVCQCLDRLVVLKIRRNSSNGKNPSTFLLPSGSGVGKRNPQTSEYRMPDQQGLLQDSAPPLMTTGRNHLSWLPAASDSTWEACGLKALALPELWLCGCRLCIRQPGVLVTSQHGVMKESQPTSRQWLFTNQITLQSDKHKFSHSGGYSAPAIFRRKRENP